MNPPLSLETLLAHREWVRSVARAVVRDPNAADDVEQETWLAALRTPPRHEGSLRGWFGAVARSRARRIGRSETRRDARETAAARGEATPSAAELAEIADTHRRVVQAVVALDEPYREAILLRYFEGLSIDEVSVRMEAPLETTRSRLKRGVARLRQRLERELGTRERPWHLALVPLVGGSRDVTAGAGIGAATGGLTMVTKVACVLGSVLAIGGVATLVVTNWRASAGEAAVAAAPPAPVPAPPPAPVPQEVPKPKPAPPVEPKPPAPVPPAKEPVRESARERLERTKLSIDWRDTPLLDAFGDLAAKSGVEIVVSAEAVEVWGRDAKIEMLRLDQEIAASQVLNLVTQLKGLAWVVEEPRVVIVPEGVTRDPSRPVVVPPKPTSGPPIVVLGQVTDGKGVAVAGARVVNVSTGASAVTDVAGRYELKVAKPTGSVQAYLPGFVPSLARLVEGQPGAQVTIDLALRGPAGSVVVTVVSTEGPLARASVSVQPPRVKLAELPDGRSALIAPSPSDTDATGVATVDGLEPGEVTIQVTAEGHALAKAEATVTAGNATRVEVRLVRETTKERLDSARISFNFQGASFGEVVKFINDAKQLSIVIDPALAPKLETTTVTLDLRDVSVATALRTLCKLAGDVEYVVDGPVVFIRAVKR